jgi:predicted N-acetyltransferase YhbS
MDIKLRSAVSSDGAACGRIIFQAFRNINVQHGFASAYTEEALAIRVASMHLDHPEVYGAVAETDGRIVGSGFLDERALVRGVGPVTVDPQFQGQGIGRRLMEHLLDRAGTAPGARLVSDAFNGQAVALYASLGFEVKEPLAVLSGRPKDRRAAPGVVRPMTSADLDACAGLCLKVHGFDRASELSDALRNLSPVVALNQGRVTAYATTFTLWPAGHAVAESAEVLQALILAAAATSPSPISFLLPTRQPNLLRWCLHQGLRVEKPMLLMSIGEYQEPRGAWLPSARL